MTPEEQKIEQIARDRYCSIKTDPHLEHLFLPKVTAYVAGAQSNAAKEYWLQKLSEEFESQSDDETIEIIEIINKVLKSDMAKEYHTKGMYSEEECYNKLADLMNDVINNGLIIKDKQDLKWWFEQNKK